MNIKDLIKFNRALFKLILKEFVTLKKVCICKPNAIFKKLVSSTRVLANLFKARRKITCLKTREIFCFHLKETLSFLEIHQEIIMFSPLTSRRLEVLLKNISQTLQE